MVTLSDIDIVNTVKPLCIFWNIVAVTWFCMSANRNKKGLNDAWILKYSLSLIVLDTREREEDSQAPPELETVEVQQQENLEVMGQFGDAGYEPSADELIDVLKNLENLAAANPGLYRTIVEQIKGKQWLLLH